MAMGAEFLMAMRGAEDDTEIRGTLMVQPKQPSKVRGLDMRPVKFLPCRRSDIACCSRRRADFHEFRAESTMPKSTIELRQWSRHAASANPGSHPWIHQFTFGVTAMPLDLQFTAGSGDDARDHPRRT